MSQLTLTFPTPERHIKRIGGEGIVTRKDITDFQRATQAVYALMKDGEWHSAQSIIDASGIREGLRRMRELKQLGLTIERRRDDGQREWEYRLVQEAT